MTETLKPGTPEQVAEAVRWAAGADTALEVLAAGSKRSFGRPVEAGHHLDLGAFTGIGLYEAEELVLAAGAATPLAEIEAALAEKLQRLEFEPPDLGPLLGGRAGRGTIGGAIACNLAGPRRIKAGAARDHVLGFHAVSGRGETFKSGGRVVKNVTGFDLSKLMAGSFGTLAVLSDVTVKVLPRPESVATLILADLDDGDAMAVMSEALSGPFNVSGAAHLPASVAEGGWAMTVLRLEGPAPSVEARAQGLAAVLNGFGAVKRLAGEASAVLWRRIADGVFFAEAGDVDQVWRLSLPPAAAAAVGGALLAELGGRIYYDWGGGLMWLAIEPRPGAAHEAVRAALGGAGHATLMRAAPEVRRTVQIFQPQPPPLAALSCRIKQGFDPKGILNPGRLVADL